MLGAVLFFVVAGSSAPFGDVDNDGDVDPFDFVILQDCLGYSGPEATSPIACSDSDADGDQDVDLEDVAAFMTEWTGRLGGIVVETGPLLTVFPSLDGYFSGEPGTVDADPLRGVATQTGYTEEDFAYAWTLRSSPDGSGQVYISNPTRSTTSFEVFPPLVSGEYVFDLEVTNLVTGESGVAFTTLNCVECLSAEECDDGVFCNGEETCNPATGQCESSGDPCTNADPCGPSYCDEDGDTCLWCPPGVSCDFGLSFTLGTDFLFGTNCDDTFNGPLNFNAPTGTNVPSVQTGDSADGGGGRDILNAQFNFGAGTTVAPTLTSIETINISDFGVASTTLSGSAVTGANAINLRNSTNSNPLRVTNLPNIVDLGVSNQAVGATLTFATAATSGANDSANLTVGGLTGAATTLTLTTGTPNGFEVLNLETVPPASLFFDIAMNGTTLTTVNVFADANLTITSSFDPSVTTVDAATSTGNVNLSQTNAGAFHFTGGAGNDTIRLGASYGSTDTIIGGAGIDTIAMSSAAAVAVIGAQNNVTSIEALTISDALVGAITPSYFGPITTVNLAAGFGGGLMTVLSATNVTLGAASTDPTGTGTGGITVSGSSVSDSVALTINDCDIGANTFSTIGVETLQIVSNGDLDGSAASGGANIFGATLTMLATAATETLRISGATQLTVVGAVQADVINASAFTGALVMSATSTGATSITGGSGNDTLYGTTGGDVLSGGAGNDTFLGQPSADIITTGSGNDHVRMVRADVGDIITDFTPGTDKFDWDTPLLSIDGTVTTPREEANAFQSGPAGNAIGPGTTVFELTGTTVASQTAANAVNALGATVTNADTNANTLFVIYTTGGGGAIWNWINLDANVEAAELTLVATFSTMTADTLSAADFE